MVFRSKLPQPERPDTDVFNFVFQEGRYDYPRDRILYRVDGTNETLTLDQLEKRSRSFASALVEQFGIKRNDVIAIHAHDSITYPIAFFGTLAAGATISPIPVQKDVGPNDIAPRLQQANAKLIISDSALSVVSKRAAERAGDIPLISLDDAGPAFDQLDQLVAKGDPSFDGFRLRSYQDADKHNAFIYRTSGSSGLIKSVLTPHSHWNANLETTRLTLPPGTDPNHDTWISSLPFAYGINAKLNLGLNVLLGIPVVILTKPFDHTTLDLIERHHITFLFVTPPLAAQIAKLGSISADLSSLKFLLSAGAPVHPKIRDAVQTKLNDIPLTLEWGTTETLLIALQIDEASSAPGSSGTLVNGMEAKVIDLQSGKELSYNQQGEIWIRSSLCRFAGYKDNDAANQDFDSDGWFHSGDVGYLDENSNVFIVDRLKELLRVGDGYGTHVSTGEIEAVLFDHPAVATAVVVGIRDEDTQQEHPTAFVVLQPDYERQADRELAKDMENTVESLLGTFKRLSGGVFFVPRYPRVGYKIDKRALKSLVDVSQTAQQASRVIEISA
ncbi:MAG: hypothetical protein M1833_001218 [Piccolia ochrophora]|nr:MAG: hypothetical protein M1833_001218 [Piccolia ochrophora]